MIGGLGCDSGSVSHGTGGSGGGAGGAGGASGEQLVEIFSWWVAPGEAEALQALVDADRLRHPTDRIFNAAADTHEDAKALLATRLAAGNPPDLFQQNAHDLSAYLTAHPGSLQNLDSFFTAQHLDTAVFPEVVSDVTVDGHIYAMPVNIHRENSLFYNRQIFADNHISPPTTIDEFLAACATLKAAGITPVETMNQGWILRIMFNSLAMGSMGTTAFHDFMTGGAGHEAELRAAIDLFANVLANYTNANKTDPALGWTDAASAVKNGQAAMFFHGDWAKGYYVQLGWTPGVDFGVVGAPGAADMFWYGVDTFSLPVGAPHLTGAMDFIDTIGSTAGQVAFNKLKGSSPVRTDVDRTLLDSEGRATLDDLKNAHYRQAVVGKDAWDNAMLSFAQTLDTEALYQVYVTSPPVQ